MEDDKALQAFNEELEQQHFYSNVNPQMTQPGMQNPGTHQTPPMDQNLINSFNPGMPPSEISASFGRCDQCGTFHPPMKQGENCPVAPIQDTKGNVVDLNPFFAQLKNICMSQIQQKGIKDAKKLFQHIIIELTKILESYNE